MEKKKDLEREKKRQKWECPGGIEPALRKKPGGAGPYWRGTQLQHADINVFIQHKFPVPHRQSPPCRLPNLNKTPLMTSARKFRLRVTTRHTIYNEFYDLQCDFYMEKRAP